MKITLRSAIIFSALFVLAFASVSEIAAQRRTTSNNRAGNYTVEAGKRIRVRMNDRLDSKATKIGDRFTVSVTEPVYSNTGVVVIPVGSELTGRVDTVKSAVKGGRVGEIDVTFVQVKLPNGLTRVINGSLSDLSEDDAKSDNEGTASGDKMKHRKAIFIGGGGAGGAVLGAAIGGGKGALIGGLIGAGAGLLGERMTKGEDVEVKPGAEFSVYLNRSVSLPAFKAAEEESRAEPTRPSYDGPSEASDRTYTVQSGDTLGSISRKVYGTSARYMEIYNANRDVLSSPNSVTVGQELRIP